MFVLYLLLSTLIKLCVSISSRGGHDKLKYVLIAYMILLDLCTMLLLFHYYNPLQCRITHGTCMDKNLLRYGTVQLKYKFTNTWLHVSSPCMYLLLCDRLGEHSTSLHKLAY